MNPDEPVPIDQCPTQRLAAVSCSPPRRRVMPYPYGSLAKVTRTQTRLVNGLLETRPRDSPPVLDVLASLLDGSRSDEDSSAVGPSPRRFYLHGIAPCSLELTREELRHNHLTMVGLPAGTDRALLAIDPVLARTIIEDLLHSRGQGPPVSRPRPALEPEPFESGILTALLLGLCQQLTSAGYPPVVLSPLVGELGTVQDWLQEHRGTLIEVSFIAELNRVRGAIRLLLSQGFIRHLRQVDEDAPTPFATPMPAVERIPVEGSIILATVDVPVREVIRLRPGDLLLPREHGLRMENLTEPRGLARIRLGKRAQFTALLRPVDGRWHMEVQHSEHEQEGDLKSDPQDAKAAEATMAMAAAVDLGVDVCVGKFSTTVGALTRMQQGTIIELDTPVGHPVDLVVDGQRIGQGELVVIEGQLGVRILHLGKPRS
jgi:flagellar motor switch protein FliN